MADQPEPADFDPAEYGRHVADAYDDVYSYLDPSDAVACLAALADGGDVLEFGIGTGRIALPLAAGGLRVDGIEGSPEMVRRLRAKPGGDRLHVEVGDFAETSMGRTYALVVLAFNTINALPDQDAQVACVRNAAAHLAPGGAFVVENWVPDVGAYRNGSALRVLDLEATHVTLEVAQLHPVEQRMTTTRIVFREDGPTLVPANHRYVWPAELDLMAQLAGLRRKARWADWRRAPFTAASTGYVVVYRKPA